MKISTEGLILTEQTVGEKDKLVTVFTKSDGIMRCFARGVKSLKNSNSSAVQTLTYSQLNIFIGQKNNIIDSGEPLHVFYDLRNDLERLSLAQYFCEISYTMLPEGTQCEEGLSLLLNSLYVLTHFQKPLLLIKSVYEMRFLSIVGFLPNIYFCSKCGCYEADKMHFIHSDSTLICDRCFDGEMISSPLSRGAVTALRHAVLSEPKKIFSFGLSDDAASQFADCAEQYILRCSNRRFSTLEFFKIIKSDNIPAPQ